MTTFSLSIAQSLITSDEQFPVNFDDAWEWLGFTRKDNAKRKFLKCGFIEGTDFALLISEERLNGGAYTNREDIRLTIDCFKMFGMMVGTEQGKKVRQYFLACEKQLKEIKNEPPTPQIQPHSGLDVIQTTQALFEIMNITPQYLPGLVAEAVKESHPEMAGTVEQMKVLMASNSENDIKSQSFTVTEIGDMLYPVMKARDVNNILRDMGLQYKSHKKWVLTELGKNNGGVVIATTQKGRSNNVEQIRWKDEIVDRINEYLEN